MQFAISLFRSLQIHDALKPAQAIVIGFLLYVVAGVGLLSIPVFRVVDVALIDNIFNVVSAISTTGLTTVSVGDSYSIPGQIIIMLLFQIGGIGYMTLSSFVILAGGKRLSRARRSVLEREFALPEGFSVSYFIKNLVIFSFIIELGGTLLLWAEFSAAGVKNPFWSALFHCVSAFATAGFSLNNDSLERFVGNVVVNGTIAFLCYMGSLGFIVLQDFWISFRRKRAMTFTSRVIILLTLAVFLIGVPLVFWGEQSIQSLPFGKRLLTASFQVMTASTTAGFNTIPISGMSAASLVVIIVAMLIGASPSGTGGGIKTTSVSALCAAVTTAVKGGERIAFFNHEIPLLRFLTAVAHATFYMAILFVGVFGLCLTQQAGFLEIFFEASSALGTVGLSMGITGNLDVWGKIIVIFLMFIGRIGPLTIGLSIFQREGKENRGPKSDLAV